MSSPAKETTRSLSKAQSKTSTQSVPSQNTGNDQYEDSTTPDFIYGGPFIKLEKPSPLLDTATPINLLLQGTFKKSFAYYSLKERLPIILTKVIDYCSREASKIKASDQDLKEYIAYISKLKNELVTNKNYELLTEDTPDAKRWNEWIRNQDIQNYFTNTWLFSECYVYRRLREGSELTKTLKNFDPFEDQKAKSFTTSLEPMCVVAERLVGMLPESDKDKRKADFIALLKICLWANKCDLSLSLGEQTTLEGASPSKASLKLIDPFQMITDFKDKLLVDDTGKIADQVVAKAENLAKAIEGNTTFKYQCSCHRLAKLAGLPLCKEEAQSSPTTPKEPQSAPAEGEQEETPKIPCPAKMVIPQAVMFDIVCDNSGYELFADLCLATFLISQKIVQKVRFHVKKIPWFVSDVTRTDFRYVIEQCRSASFSKTVAAEVKPDTGTDGTDADAAPQTREVTAEHLHTLGDQWSQYLEDGSFILMSDEFWTSPHPFKDMKKYDPLLYRKLQFAVAVMFKGDLNYRKLLGEKKWPPTTGFEASLAGFIPAPVIAVRTVKAELISGLPKGKYEQITKIDDKWMQKGDYGVIQFCAKAEPLKVADRPCLDYGDECKGQTCPIHSDL